MCVVWLSPGHVVRSEQGRLRSVCDLPFLGIRRLVLLRAPWPRLRVSLSLRGPMGPKTYGMKEGEPHRTGPTLPKVTKGTSQTTLATT
jgi:hypothetical protein